MRIALFTETFLPATDGVVTRLRHTIEELVQMGDEVLIFAPAGGPDSYAGARIFHVAGFPFPPYPEKRLAPPHPGIGRALRAFRPDVIHVVNPVVLGLGGVYYARRLGVPLVASYHTNLTVYARYYKLGFTENMLWGYLKTLHNQAQVNLCTSQATQEQLLRAGIKRIRVWPQGVDSGRFDPSLASDEWRNRLSGGHPDRTILLYVGRLAPEKHIERLMPVLDEVGNVSLAIVGDGPARQYLELEFSGNSTVFTGLLYGEDLARAYASSDIFLFPSTTETLGMVMLEALASGLPVVAARAGATGEVVEDGVNGLLYETRSNNSLVDAVKLLVEYQDVRKKMSTEARLAAERVNWAAATRTLRRYYEVARRGGRKEIEGGFDLGSPVR